MDDDLSVDTALGMHYALLRPSLRRAIDKLVYRCAEHGVPNSFKVSELEQRERQDAYILGKLSKMTPTGDNAISFYGSNDAIYVVYDRGWFTVRANKPANGVDPCPLGDRLRFAQRSPARRVNP